MKRSLQLDHAEQMGAGTKPLRVMFVNTHLSVGGAETLLVALMRRMDRARFQPELCCLKQPGLLGEELAAEMPVHSQLLHGKLDVRVIGRLAKLYRQREIDAVVTVGTGGDKMFWGRLAAWRAGVPVVLSALHSTGLPDRVERSNRCLARWTDGFIAVAPRHGQYIAQSEGCPANKVFVIPNGVDIQRFAPARPSSAIKQDLGIAPTDPVVGVVAVLRPEKNHPLLLSALAHVRQQIPNVRLLIIGDGPCRQELERLTADLGLTDNVRFLGSRSDVPTLLPQCNLVALTSHMEANPVSLLEAMACGRPVVATRVGSVPDSVSDGETGLLVPPGDQPALTAALVRLLSDSALAERFGTAARHRVVQHFSLDRMTAGYEDLITEIYSQKRPSSPIEPPQNPAFIRLLPQPC